MKINVKTSGFKMKHLFFGPLFSTLALFALLPLLVPQTSYARLGGNLGLGVEAGVPSGICGKYWMGDNNAFEGTLGFDLRVGWIKIDADYIWHEFSMFHIPMGQLGLFYGGGPWVALADKPAIGLRGVVGVEYLFPSAPIDAFFKLGPGISVIPSTDFDPNVSVGMRYFF